MKRKGMFLSLFDKDGNSSPHRDEKMMSFRSCVLFFFLLLLLLLFLSNSNPNCVLLVFFVSLLFFSPFFFSLPFSLFKNVTVYTSVCIVVIVICIRFDAEKA